MVFPESWQQASQGEALRPEGAKPDAFQHDLERAQLGTADIHVDEHHAVCVHAIQCLARKHFGCQKQGPRKHWLTLRTLDPDGSCQGPPQDEENGLRETQT